MKKITLNILLFALLLSSTSAEACSPDPDADYPTIIGILSEGGVVTLGKSLSDGRVVAVERLESSTESSPSYFVMQAPGHSCTERFGEFEEGEYVVSVTPGIVTMLSNSEFDSEFTFYFDSLDQAQEKYTELTTNEPNIDPSNTRSYVPVGYTLRRGIQGKDVAELQKALNSALGLNLTLDGDYGRGTLAAVKQYQELYRLFPDGIAGNNTQIKLSQNTYSEYTQGPVIDTNKTDKFGRIISSRCQVASFCNGPIECLDATLDVSNMAGTCEYSEIYACYKNAGNICELQSTGNCGWTQTDELQVCILDVGSEE